jgi:hypothetical protein
MFLSLLKDRLSFTLAVVVAGLVTALITGNGIAAAIVGISAGLLVNAFLAARSDRTSPDLGDQPRRRRGHPFFFQFTWNADSKADLAQAVQALASQGLTPSSGSASETNIILKGGSQLRTRLRGGYFVDPRHLPIRAELRAMNRGNGDCYRLELQIRDTLGMAMRDKALEVRYAKAAARISEVVEDSLRLHQR